MASDSSQQNEDVADLTTDACPSPPRADIPPDDQLPSTSSSEPKYETKPKAYVKPMLAGKNRNRKMPRPRKLLSAQAVANVININNSNGIHIGSNYTYNMGREEQDDEDAEEEEKCVVKTVEICDLLKRTDPVTKKIIIYVAKHIGKNWRAVIRTLDYSDGQLDQYYEKYNAIGVREIVYQLLLDWIQFKTDKATVGILSTALWEASEKAVVQGMAKNTIQRLARGGPPYK